MLIALSGYVTGYDGKFPFEKPGDKYENTSYVGMRFVRTSNKIHNIENIKFVKQFCASLGASIIPMSFETVYEMTHSIRASIFAATFLLCGKKEYAYARLNSKILINFF